LTERQLAQDHSGKECSESQRHAKQLGGTEGYAQCDREHRKTEQLTPSSMCDVMKDPRNNPPSDIHHKPNEYGNLDKRQEQNAWKPKPKAGREGI
jgi:hypothetical protein